MKKKIAVALWVDSMHVPAWVHEMLLHINAGGYASLQLVILNKSNHKKGGGSFAKLMRNFSYAAFILYRKFENRYAKVKPDAQQLKNVSDIIKSGAVIHVNPSQKNNHLFFTDNDIQQLRQQDIDVCIKIGNGILPDEALACSRYGFWRFDDGNDFIKRGIYSGVHEVINGEDVTVNALLMQLAGKDKPLVLYKSAGATANGIKKNINLVYRKSLSFIPRKLKQLHAHHARCCHGHHVAGADEARVPCRGAPRGAPGIQHGHPGSGADQAPGGGQADGPGADDHHVPGGHGGGPTSLRCRGGPCRV